VHRLDRLAVGEPEHILARAVLGEPAVANLRLAQRQACGEPSPELGREARHVVIGAPPGLADPLEDLPGAVRGLTELLGQHGRERLGGQVEEAGGGGLRI